MLKKELMPFGDIELSRKLNMLTVAEFVETKEECFLLDELGCDYYQGYYFSKPVDVSKFWEIMNQQSKY